MEVSVASVCWTVRSWRNPRWEGPTSARQFRADSKGSVVTCSFYPKTWRLWDPRTARFIADPDRSDHARSIRVRQPTPPPRFPHRDGNLCSARCSRCGNRNTDAERLDKGRWTRAAVQEAWPRAARSWLRLSSVALGFPRAGRKEALLEGRAARWKRPRSGFTTGECEHLSVRVLNRVVRREWSPCPTAVRG